MAHWVGDGSDPYGNYQQNIYYPSASYTNPGGFMPANYNMYYPTGNSRAFDSSQQQLRWYGQSQQQLAQTSNLSATSRDFIPSRVYQPTNNFEGEGEYSFPEERSNGPRKEWRAEGEKAQDPRGRQQNRNGNQGNRSWQPRYGQEEYKRDGQRNYGNYGGAGRANNYSKQNNYPRNQYPRNNGGSGRFNSEDAKSEGRMKLLSEAASLISLQSRDNKPDKSAYWAEPAGGNNSYGGKQHGFKQSYNRRENKKKEESVAQRDRLIGELNRGALECLVCCERVRGYDKVWSCIKCHLILHLNCVVKWAQTSSATGATDQAGGWRCPACQSTNHEVPTIYSCFCGKTIDPPWVKGETPHCCGHICGKRNNCEHTCTLLCHPGPCPQCNAFAHRACGCGRTSQNVLCSSTVALTCDSECLKVLNCGIHYCMEKCHQGDCEPCKESILQTCYCKAEERSVECQQGVKEYYSCGKPCSGLLECGEHGCTKTCHEGSCGSCPLDPAVVKTCHCGATPIEPGQRQSCKDPVPCCSNACGASLRCGHDCSQTCHPGACPDCTLSSTLPCRCGKEEKEVLCKDLITNGGVVTCNRRCTKKRNCGKHKCNQNCCIEVDHLCGIVCGKTLSCGRHKCQQLCHRGNCQPCPVASYEELHCECGRMTVYPPVPCGTRPPECTAPCTRQHACSHTPTHNCHSQAECPPCTTLVSRHCFGGHELRKAVPCHLGAFSCGRACGRALPACTHRCTRLCHEGPCLESDARCTKPCAKQRYNCPHPCGVACHPTTPCPSPPSPCNAPVTLACPCGLRTQPSTCAEARRLATARNAKVGSGPDIPTSTTFKVLECNDDCKIHERNLRMAIGLQIANPDLSAKLHPRYSENMRHMAKKSPAFCQTVHSHLTQLVKLAKESKQKSRSYSFAPMNWEKRQFVHEYCDHFGCESMAYDEEPKRNVVATAYKDKCWLPSYSLLETIERENGRRKIPVPTIRKVASQDSQMVPVRPVKQPSPPKEEDMSPPAIDYFENPPKP